MFHSMVKYGSRFFRLPWIVKLRSLYMKKYFFIKSWVVLHIFKIKLKSPEELKHLSYRDKELYRSLGQVHFGSLLEPFLGEEALFVQKYDVWSKTSDFNCLKRSSRWYSAAVHCRGKKSYEQSMPLRLFY